MNFFIITLLISLVVSEQKLQIFYDSYCQKCSKILGKNLNDLLKKMQNFDELTIELNPFLNGSFYEFQNRNLFTCPEGPNECDMDQIQSCILNNIEDRFLSTKFISCLNYFMNKTPNETNQTYYQNCKKIIKLDEQQIQHVDICVQDKDQKEQALIQYAQGSVNILQDSNPAIKFLNRFLNLEETFQFYQNPFEYICRNSDFQFCIQAQIQVNSQQNREGKNQNQIVQQSNLDVQNVQDQNNENSQNQDNKQTETNQNIIKNLEDVNKLIQNYQNNTNQKFDFFKNTISDLNEQLQQHNIDTDTITQKLKKFQTEFQQSIQEKPKQQTKLVSLAKINHEDQEQLIQEINAQNNYIYEAIINRLELLKEDFVDQIDNINENIDKAQFQQNAFIQQKLRDLKSENDDQKVIQEKKVKINSLEEKKNLPTMIKIKIKKIDQDEKNQQNNNNDNQETQINAEQHVRQSQKLENTQIENKDNNYELQQENNNFQEETQQQNIQQNQNLLGNKETIEQQEFTQDTNQSNIQQNLTQEKEEISNDPQNETQDLDNQKIQNQVQNQDDIQQKSILFKEEQVNEEAINETDEKQQQEEVLQNAIEEFNQQ